MTNRSALLGWSLLGSAAVVLVLGLAFLLTLRASGETSASGAVLGIGLVTLLVVLPLAAAGAWVLAAARREAGENRVLGEQRRLLEMMLAQGRVTLAEAALELGVPLSTVQAHVRRLVGLEIFSGSVDWKRGVLHSREAAALRADQACIACGGRLELAGKGIVSCPHCGAETFLVS